MEERQIGRWSNLSAAARLWCWEPKSIEYEAAFPAGLARPVLMRVKMGYPSLIDEIHIETSKVTPILDLQPV